MANEKTPNYHWDIPNPYGLQIVEMIKVASTFGAIDSRFKAFEDAYLSHKHSFADITDRPTTLNGYGITDAITTDQVKSEIETSQAAQQSLIDQSISNLANSTAAALDARLRFDAPQAIPLIQRARARANINALGIEDKGAPNGVATLDAGGKIPSSQLPPVAITDTFVVNSQASMLALAAERGDVAIRTDLKQTFILRLEPATVLANWQEIMTPADGVLTVNGETGAVINLTASHINLGNVANKSEAQMVAAGEIANALGGKFDKAGGTLSGKMTAKHGLEADWITLSSAQPVNPLDAATKAYVDSKSSIGVGVGGQTWQDMTPHRAKGTAYLNNTGRPIMVNLSQNKGGDTLVRLYVNWIEVGHHYDWEASGGRGGTVSAIVPDGQHYHFDWNGTSGQRVLELR